jgi:thioredoxin 1
MSQDTNKMSVFVKVAIILVLAVAVGAVVVVKQSEKVEESQALSPLSEASDTDKAPIPKLLDLGATKCIPCKMMEPILEALKEEYKGQFDVVFIDVWENPAESRKHGVKLIPTQIFFDADGKELFRHEGFYSREDILAKWKELGIAFGEAKPEAAVEESIS